MINHWGKRVIAAVAIALLVLGCTAPGRIYTNITRPYSKDFKDTSVGSKRVVLNEHSIREPVSGYGITVEWSASQIVTEARRAGITRIAYIEEETLSILLGIYQRKRLIVYGD